jgi:hypothetical protein
LMSNLIEMVTDGLIEVQETNITHIARISQNGPREDKNG